jgi:hypothetical protein
MNPFTYSRVVDSNEAVTGIACETAGKISWGRHESHRSDENGRGDARRLDRHQPFAACAN